MTSAAVALLIGALGGAVTGLLGFGGAAVIPPLLGATLGLGQHAAQAVALAGLLPPVGYPALRAYQRAGVRLHWRRVGGLMAGFALGAAGGGALAQHLDGGTLRRLFAAFLFYSAGRAVLRSWRNQPEAPPSTVPDRLSWASAGAGLAAGAIAGLLGIGGALVVAPVLRRVDKLSRLEAQAATVAMMLPPIALPAVVAYAHGPEPLPWTLLAAVAVGFSLGALVGGRWAVRLPGRAVSALFAVVMAALGVLMLLK